MASGSRVLASAREMDGSIGARRRASPPGRGRRSTDGTGIGPGTVRRGGASRGNADASRRREHACVSVNDSILTLIQATGPVRIDGRCAPRMPAPDVTPLPAARAGAGTVGMLRRINGLFTVGRRMLLFHEGGGRGTVPGGTGTRRGR
ncbi:hypothetical protein Maq22A_c27840 [Methylobacterium aquaticum]|uniref:Uncharacterized protein n=1 Tax=Methylobacterium aquaticum TaxID=270351 RepID=A0A1Y0ZIE7_9HYPH|nr:hypothetical protein Maq22A_c27840 [Methylobacterium aquaticum]